MELKEGLLKHLEELAFFLEYKGENPFRIRAYQKALGVLEGVEGGDLAEKIANKSLLDLPGIGKGILAISEGFLKNKTSNEWLEARGDLPLSILELRQISGLGVKKIKELYEALQISSLGELEYACEENRLIELKGFGEKTQEKILQEIQNLKLRQGKFILSDALEQAERIEKKFPKNLTYFRVGDIGRMLEVVDGFDYLIDDKSALKGISDKSLKLRFHKEKTEFLPIKRIQLTSSEEHWKSLEKAAADKKISLKEKFQTEEEVYQKLGLPFREAYERELPVSAKQKPNTLKLEDLTGVFHLHTNLSDGTNTLDEMAAAARKQGWSFMGLSDHSKTAFYANGLSEEMLKQQSAEVDALNKKYPDFKILRGIESDILKDGSLDYSPSVLNKLDFVIASIHSRYGMKEMTDRILKAIENPNTTMIGHLTGRLLLGRDGYQIDYPKIIAAAIKNKKVIELNSHPHRLDIDWRYLNEACEKGLIISINPDAHSVHGFDHVKYGVWMARKAGVPKENILNTWPLEKIQKFLSGGQIN